MIVRKLAPTLFNDTFGLCYALPVCYQQEVCYLLCFWSFAVKPTIYIIDRVVFNLNVLSTF